jgi:6-phosphogluconate dehydrogenase
MGSNMVKRLIKAGHECVVYARRPDPVNALVKVGAVGATSLEDLVSKLDKPRAIWLMIPAASVDGELEKLAPLLDEGDIIIDGGNSFYQDDIRRAAELKPKGIHYMDCGTSGGVWGLERGYCLMIGGEEETARHLDPIFAALAPGESAASTTPGRENSNSTADQGYLYCGPHGAGHFVKMVHNGIEYGLMAAYAEGFNVLHGANVGNQSQAVNAETAPLRNPEYFQYELNLPDIAELWRRGSVVASWLLDLSAAALANNASLSDYSGRVSDSGEGRWTLSAAIDEGIPVPVLSAALYQRFTSRGESEYANKLLSAMRFQFGGHLEQNPDAHAGPGTAHDRVDLAGESKTDQAKNVAKASEAAGGTGADGATNRAGS